MTREEFTKRRQEIEDTDAMSWAGGQQLLVDAVLLFAEVVFDATEAFRNECKIGGAFNNHPTRR